VLMPVFFLQNVLYRTSERYPPAGFLQRHGLLKQQGKLAPERSDRHMVFSSNRTYRNQKEFGSITLPNSAPPPSIRHHSYHNLVRRSKGGGAW
jgi:hypothetical protein